MTTTFDPNQSPNEFIKLWRAEQIEMHGADHSCTGPTGSASCG